MTSLVLDSHINRRLGAGLDGGEPVERALLEKHQLALLRSTIAYAREHSVYYREQLSGLDLPSSLGELRRYPIMRPDALIAAGMKLLCVPQSHIARIVTLSTSGTSGGAKRLFFTADDQELTCDYFHEGMKTLVFPGDTVVVFMNCATVGSVGDLLSKGLARLGARAVRYGAIGDLGDAVAALCDTRADSFVASPVTALWLSEYAAQHEMRTNVKRLLLSADALPVALKRRVEENLGGAEVFEHYGMTEMGLGGAIDCASHTGLHPREYDLLFEIVDEKGDPAAEGEYGELVFTTLTRCGAPLIRYAAGDISRFIQGECPCGSALKRIAPPRRAGNELLSVLDEALFGIAGVCDYTAVFHGDAIEIAVEYLLRVPDIAAVAARVKECVAECEVRVTLSPYDEKKPVERGKRRLLRV